MSKTIPSIVTYRDGVGFPGSPNVIIGAHDGCTWFMITWRGCSARIVVGWSASRPLGITLERYSGYVPSLICSVSPGARHAAPALIVWRGLLGLAATLQLVLSLPLGLT